MEEKKESILTGILSISGKPGLFKTVSQAGSKLIVESLVDGRKSAATSANQVISLADVSIYGEDEEMPFENILKTMFKMENGEKCSVTPKASNTDLYDYFSDVFPEYDKDKVYPSDIKKVIRWYNLLLEKGLIKLDEEKAEEAAE